MKNDGRIIYVLVLFILVSATSFTNFNIDSSNSINFGGWIKLGKQQVSEGVDYDTLDITEEKKNIKRLKLKVLKTSVYLSSIKVIYEDNTSENHMISRRLDKGDSTRAFDLIGHHRMIKKILFIYRNGRSSRGGAQLVVMAKS